MKNNRHNSFDAGIKGLKKSLSMTAREKELMLGRLLEHIDASEVAQPSAVRSPFSYAGILSIWNASYTRVVVAMLVFCVIGASASYAAEGALPGDLLYAMKVRVNEPLISALTIGTVPKAKWEAQKAERRLGEANALASEGKLDEKTRVELGVEFRKSVSVVSESLDMLERAGASSDAKNLRASLEASAREDVTIFNANFNAKRRDVSKDKDADKGSDREKERGRGVEKEGKNEEGERGEAPRKIREDKIPEVMIIIDAPVEENVSVPTRGNDGRDEDSRNDRGNRDDSPRSDGGRSSDSVPASVESAVDAVSSIVPGL